MLCSMVPSSAGDYLSRGHDYVSKGKTQIAQVGQGVKSAATTSASWSLKTAYKLLRHKPGEPCQNAGLATDLMAAAW